MLAAGAPAFVVAVVAGLLAAEVAVASVVAVVSGIGFDDDIWFSGWGFGGCCASWGACRLC
jgi:hypothetical protein